MIYEQRQDWRLIVPPRAGNRTTVPSREASGRRAKGKTDRAQLEVPGCWIVGQCMLDLGTVGLVPVFNNGCVTRDKDRWGADFPLACSLTT